MNISEEELKIIQAKQYINVKEFTLIFGFSADWQKNRRQRINNALPHIQTVKNGKIIYEISAVQNWLENENIRF